MTRRGAGAILALMPAWTSLHWRWFVMRCLGLLPLGFVAAFLTLEAAHALRVQGFDASFCVIAGLAAVAGATFYFAARKAWRVWNGAFIDEGEMRLGIRVLTVLGGLFVLFLLVFVPKLLELLRVSSEGGNKGALGLMRQELAVHQAAHAGIAPARLDELLRPGVFPALPDLWRSNPAAPHRRTAAWRPAASAEDSGEWAYGDGAVYIDCTHTDHKGSVWSSY